MVHGLECDSLWDVFTHYDGNILTSTNEQFLKLQRMEIDKVKSFDNVYIFTHYFSDH